MVGFRTDCFDASRAAPDQFRVISGIPSSRRETQSLALLGPPDIVSEQFHDKGVTRLVLGFGQPIRFSGEFLRYFYHARHGHKYLNLNLTVQRAQSAGIRGDRQSINAPPSQATSVLLVL
jgi:hypothetical protein